MQDIQKKIDALSEGNLPESVLEGFAPTLLAIGADGVMVPHQTNSGSHCFKTVWSQEGWHYCLVTKKGQ